MYCKKQTLVCVAAYLLLLTNGQQFNENDKKVDIAVYFEALCSDSREFIIEELYPNWEEIKDYVNIQFLPFGKSYSLENGKKFSCQHGAPECKGNRIMSCALRRIPNQDLQVQYLRCFMDDYKNAITDKSLNGKRCAQIVGLDIDDIIKNCYHTKEGTNLQLQAEIDTKKLNLRFVPTIVYNEVFDQELQDQTIENFRDTLCGLIHRSNPGACSYRTVIPI